MNKSSNKSQKHGEHKLTERDIAILYDLYKTKYKTTAQIQKQHWKDTKGGRFGALKSCQRRLRQLVAYGLIRRIQQAVKRKAVSQCDLLTLDKASIPILVNEFRINPRQIDLRPWVNEENNPQIKHLLETTDVQIAWQNACEACAVDIEVWLDDKEIRIQYANDAGLFVDAVGNTLKKPIADAFTIINWQEKRGYFWLEVDRSNINVNLSLLDRPSIAGKLLRFLDWEDSSQFREEFGSRPLRKLFITRGNGRMHNMLLAAEQIMSQRVDEQTRASEEEKQAESARLAKRFLFTTFDQFYANNPLTQPIWYTVGISSPQSLLG